MAYPRKYRERVMEYIAEGHTQKEAIQVFKVSKTAIQGWIKLKAETGSLTKRELNRKPRKYDPEKIEKILEETPDAYLSEIAEHFEGGTVPGIQTALKRAKITLKKRRKPTKSKTRGSETSIKSK
jgi:transposase